MSIEFEPIYRELLQLRIKQVNGKLSHEEQQELKTVIRTVEQPVEEKYGKNDDYNQSQEERWVSFHAYRNISFYKIEPKRSVMDVLLRRPAPIPEIQPYGVTFDDYQEGTLQYRSVLTLKSLFEDQHMTCTFSELIPATFDEFLVEDVTEEQKHIMERLPEPQWGLSKLEALEGLEEKLANNRELQEMVSWLKEMWQNEYKVIADFDVALKFRVPEQ
ncbi:hypothetical protein [Geomicrobium sp. JCM 19038]|uniref:hypothetical protein n=1 Tax=Geomicrobium sp. JCM 19038 TaxID=1460635 RepID=UPI00045F394C|nr:hypothetical protein [Geomicrobium sp. JCM 19038]GAK06850.1 hypothetical protein JCM19038_560 [Geomicrobium sp. JCM 19038]